MFIDAEGVSIGRMCLCFNPLAPYQGETGKGEMIRKGAVGGDEAMNVVREPRLKSS